MVLQVAGKSELVEWKGKEGELISFQTESTKRLSNADLWKKAIELLATTEKTSFSYDIEMEILRRIKENELPQRLFLTLDSMKWRTPLEKEVIIQLEGVAYLSEEFNLYTDILQEQFEKNKPSSSSKTIGKERDKRSKTVEELMLTPLPTEETTDIPRIDQIIDILKNK